VRRPSCTGLVLAATLLALAGCAAPLQEGGVDVAPGAGARLLLAMRFGHAAVGEAVRPAEVRRAVFAQQLPVGPRSTGRLGDYVLDNGRVGVVVANVDGTARSGKLVDLARWGATGDELDALETRVLGKPVRYETLKTGYDAALGAAYVSVTATVETPAGARASVETRYDLAPGLDTVLVSTRVKLSVAPPADADAETDGKGRAPLIEDRIALSGSRPALTDVRGPFVAALGESAGYALQPAADGELRGDAMIVPASKTPAEGVDFLYSRTLTALERPDSLAAEVAYARTLGEPLGELEVTVDSSSPARTGDLELVAKDDRRLVARAVPACGTPRAYRITVPVGDYGVSFRNAMVTSERARTRVASERVAFVEVATRASTEPYAAAAPEPRCPATGDVALSGP
jgi:hypothetical protein